MGNLRESASGSSAAPTPAGGPNTSRRGFLLSLLGTLIAITAATFIYPVLEYLSPRKSDAAGHMLLGVDGRPIPMTAVGHNAAVVGMGVDGEATIVVQHGGELRAFSAVCTHLGCLVKWNAGASEFICPCHGGKFDANGVNVFGPPPSPLKRFRPFPTADGNIGLEEIAA